MLDFASLRNKTLSLNDLAKYLTKDKLEESTNEMIDTMLDMIAGCTDADVVFVPNDPEAYDPAAATEEELSIAWTLGHVIVHATASSEEAAFLAAEMARGVRMTGRRSRSEVYWESITTIDQCRHRLEESRRMRLATLAMWPDEPYLDNTFALLRGGPKYVTEDRPDINAVARFILGLMHDDSHLGQIAEIVRQAKERREVPQSAL